jgi:hypothetical protein
LEHFQHRDIFRQDVRNQFLDPGVAGELREMAHQSRADALSLIVINHCESDLGSFRPHDDVTSAADDESSSGVFRNGDQSYVVDEINVEEERLLALRKMWQGDFLLLPLEGEFTHVIGNPPYVRQELIPDVLMAEYRRRFSTIFDRADIYVPFIERSLSLLAPGANPVSRTTVSAAGKRNFQGRDKEAETASKVQGRRCRDKVSLNNPANSGLVSEN